MKIKDRILSLMRAEDYIPLNKEGIIEELELDKRECRKLNYELRLLLAKGEIARVKRDCYCIPQDVDLVAGKINFRQNGSAIVVPEVADAHGQIEPILIEAHDTGVSMHGDKVLVRINDEATQQSQTPWERAKKKSKRRNAADANRRSGRVIRILEKARSTIVGNLKKTRFFHYVVPDDPRLINDIYVKDPKTSKVSPKPKIGSKVVVKLHPWEQRHVNPEGEIILNLGTTHEPQAELMAIFHKYDLNPAFPKAVLAEAKSIPPEVQSEQVQGRRDMREVFTFTIDPDDAKDFDDALSIETIDDNTLRIGIHIADVGAYVYPGTELDKEAHQRGNSTYLVGTVVPMLPHELSNGICSLKEGVDRLAKAVFIDFDKNGKSKNVDFANTVIRSNKRLTYKQAYALLKNDDLQVARDFPLPPAHQTGSTGRSLAELSDNELQGLQDGIRQLWAIASAMRTRRMKSGSLNLEMSETKIFVDESGFADRLEKVVHDESHQLIEEFMLAANETVAREMKRASLPCVYRVHDKPDEEKLNDLRDYLSTFEIKTGDLSQRPEMARAIKAIEKHPQGHLMKTQLLRSLKKAKYSADPDGHYGLSKQDYCHFTSPIRRYSDLVTHRVFDFYLQRKKNLKKAKVTRYSAAKIATISDHLSRSEINSQEAERESVKVKLMEFFERELQKDERSTFGAVITEVRNHGMFIELTESNAFGMIHVSTLRDDLYRLNQPSTALVGRRHKRKYEVGQSINVQTERVDRFKRQVDFCIVGTKKPKRNR